MKKLKNEKELLKKAIAEGMKYGEQRGVVEFEPTDSAQEKIEYIYRLLVHDGVIQPLPQLEISQKSMAPKLNVASSNLVPRSNFPWSHCAIAVHNSATPLAP